MDEHPVYDRIPLTELRDRAGLGNIGDKVAATGEPVIVTRQGQPHFMVAPLAMLRPEALPPAYFDREQRERDGRTLDEYLGENFAPDTIRAAMNWAENLDEQTGPADPQGGTTNAA
jgi:antitoxin (DNA-binding transcriptional repressor) of toxin-antitoxin stability system